MTGEPIENKTTTNNAANRGRVPACLPAGRYDPPSKNAKPKTSGVAWLRILYSLAHVKHIHPFPKFRRSNDLNLSRPGEDPGEDMLLSSVARGLDDTKTAGLKPAPHSACHRKCG